MTSSETGPRALFVEDFGRAATGAPGVQRRDAVDGASHGE
jgi:hypothetical protein